MKLESLLPILGLILAVAAIFVRDGAKPPEKTSRRDIPVGAFLILAILVGVIVLGSFSGFGGMKDAFPVGLSFGIGAALAAVSYAIGFLPGQSAAGRAAPIAMAAATVSVLALLPYPSMPLALAFGAAAAAWFLSIGKEEEPNPWAMRSAIAVIAIVALNNLGAQAGIGQYGPAAGTLMGLAAATAALLGGGIAAASKNEGLRSYSALAILVLAGWLVGDKLLTSSMALVLVAGGGVLALVINALVPEELEVTSSLRLVVASAIWISAGTAAFSFERGYGVALVFLSGVVMLLVAGNRRALLTMGPLGALVMYRVFRETHLDATKAFDIGQHYTMIGLTIGALLPVMAQEWLRTVAKRGGFLALIAGALWIGLLLIGPVGVAILLGAKGVIGYLFGLGLAAVMEAVRGEKSAHALSLGLALSGIMNLLYDALAPYLELDRADKLAKLGWVGGAIVLLGVIIAVLSGEFKRSNEGNA